MFPYRKYIRFLQPYYILYFVLSLNSEFSLHIACLLFVILFIICFQLFHSSEVIVCTYLYCFMLLLFPIYLHDLCFPYVSIADKQQMYICF